MRLTAIILLSACLAASARTTAQTVSFSGKDVSLQTVFDAVTKQTGYTVFCNYNLLQNAKKVSLRVKNATIDRVMQEALKEQPLTYTIIEKTIVVKEKPVAGSDNEANSEAIVPPPIDVKGRILNENGEPVFATVMVKGTNKGTNTNADGYFELKGVDDNATLVITASNIETREIKLNGRSELDVVSVKMKNSPLDEIQIQAYGTTNRRTGIGDITSIKSSDIEKQPVTNPLLALQGRVSGLQVTQTSGVNGSGVIVRIQGQNSLQNGSGPLYVVDGVPLTTEIPTPGQTFGPLSNSGDTYVRGGYIGRGNTLNYLNPSDIESIEVLKDADATAIYGSRAANGAILITTKKGKAGKASVSANVQKGVGQVGHFMDLLNTTQYLAMRNEAFKNDGRIPSANNAASGQFVYAPDLTLWDTARYTNWQKELIGGSAQYTNISANVSGGSSAIQYLFGANYNKQTTVFPGDFSDQISSVHLSLSNNDVSQKFHFQLKSNYSIDLNKLPSTDLTNIAIQLVPDAPALYNPDGSLNWVPDANGRSTFINPMAKPLYDLYDAKTYNLIANSQLSYDILPGLTMSSSFGFTNIQSRDTRLTSLSALKPEDRLLSYNTRAAFYGDSKAETWIVEPQITYRKVHGKSKLNILVGSTFQETSKEAQRLAAGGFNSDQVMRIPTAAATLTAQGYVKSKYRYNAFFGRLNHTWADKYIINLTGRRDGSSRFGPLSRFHNFWSVGGGWIITQEPFLRNNKSLSFLSFAKLKGNYGTVGNDQIGDYRYLTLYNLYNTSVPYQNTIGLAPGDIPNPYLQWEETKKLSFGIDLGFLNDRILLTSNYSLNKSSNQLLDYYLPQLSGRPSVLRNFPATVQNTNWEFSLNSENIKTKSFNWSTSINITIPRNKLIAFENLGSSPYSQSYIIGQSISLQKLYHYIGVDPATGLYSFADAHGNPTASPNRQNDRTVLISNFSKYYGGLQNSLQYKNFELSFFIQFAQQIAPSTDFGFSFNAGRFSTANNIGNQPVSVLNRWQKPGDVERAQKFTVLGGAASTSFSNMTASDTYYSDASYARLKNLSLSWELPLIWKQKAHLQNCKLYIEGQNLFTITKYNGLDPETQSLSSLPPLRIITGGLQIKL